MVYVLLGNGFEETEAVAPIDLMRRAGIEVVSVGLNGDCIVSSHKIKFVPDVTIEETEFENLEMIVLPGGLGGVASCRSCPKALDALKKAWQDGKFVAAICAGPTVLADLHITDGLHATCFPGCEKDMGSAIMENGKATVTDGRLITGTSAGCAVPFGLALVRALKGEEKAEEIAKQIVIR